jgi:hypothetical protein
VALDPGPEEEIRDRRDREGVAPVGAARLLDPQVPELRDLEARAFLAGHLTWSWINSQFASIGESSTYPA